MKKLILFIAIALMFTSCEQSISQREKKAARERKDVKVEEPVATVTDTPVAAPVAPAPVPYYEPATTYTQLTTVPTYWYIGFDEVSLDGTDYLGDWHWAIKLDVPYFDFMEAMEAMPTEVKGKVYFNYMLQISKESYDSFFTFKTIYHNK